MSEKAKKGKTKEKSAKGKKGQSPAGAMSVAAHPRAAAHVRLAKSWGSLIAFALTFYIATSHGVSADTAALRAIVAGLLGGVIARGCAVAVWRHLMVAELRARVERAKAALEVPAE